MCGEGEANSDGGEGAVRGGKIHKGGRRKIEGVGR